MTTYTTRLLNIIDDRMPRRHQVIVAVLVAGLTILSIVGSVASRPAAQASPRVIILIATPTPAPARAMGLAKEAAPLGAVLISAPTAAPAPTVETQITNVEQAGGRPSDKPAPRRAHERTTDKTAPGH